MKELFCFTKLDKDEQEIINSVDYILLKLHNDEQPVTQTQLYYQLIRDNVINGKDVPFPSFYKLLKKGLYGGYVDWDHIVSSKPLHATNSTSRPVGELWVRAANMQDWFRSKYLFMGIPVAYTSKLYWDPWQLYKGAGRAYDTIISHGRQNINYITDYFSQSDHMYKKMKQRLKRMVQVKLARRIFNLEHSKANFRWTPGGFMGDYKKHSTMRRYATNALQKALVEVNKKLVFNFMGVRKDTKLSNETFDGRLETLPVTTLTSMLYGLMI
jgi:hypothetical protein